MSKIKGGDMMLFVEGVSIAYATSHTLTINADTTDTSNKDEGGGGWRSEEVNILSWEASTENLMSDDGAGLGYDALIGYMVAKQPIDAVFGQKSSNATEVPSGGWTGSGYSGKVLITNIEINATNGETATFTATFTGVGALDTGHVTSGAGI